MIPRNISQALQDALTDNPVVLLNGARQTGKSTLVQQLLKNGHEATYYSFDDAINLSAATASPDAFLASLQGNIVLDEVQRIPELFRAIKVIVDKDRQPGRFLLTGSADVLLLPKVTESLAGRIEILTLWPFSQGELEERYERFIDAVFSDTLPSVALLPEPRERLLERIISGGYPEIQKRKTLRRQRRWFGSYVTTILQRDVLSLANIEGLTQMPRLLALLAARMSTLLNYSDLSSASGIAQTTLKRYMTLLETTFLIQMIPAWTSNMSKRLIKAPKLLFIDTGLGSHLTDVTKERIANSPQLIGAMLENFVGAELLKQITWSETRPELFHFRTSNQHEVDFVLEDRAGRLVGIEVKAASIIDEKAFRGLKVLQDAKPNLFHRGLVLYGGHTTVAFGSNLHAVPITSLWKW